MYNPTSDTTPSRHADRARYDAATVHEILDQALICHVGFIAEDHLQVLPMTFVRMGSVVYLHGSTGAHLARMAARKGGLEVALEVSIVDALVFATRRLQPLAQLPVRGRPRHGCDGGGRVQEGEPRRLDGEARAGAKPAMSARRPRPSCARLQSWRSRSSTSLQRSGPGPRPTTPRIFLSVIGPGSCRSARFAARLRHHRTWQGASRHRHTYVI